MLLHCTEMIDWACVPLYTFYFITYLTEKTTTAIQDRGGAILPTPVFIGIRY